MEAIKKKMQMLKVDKEDALDRAESAEQSKKAAEEKAGRAEEELQSLLKKQKATEEELGSAKERLTKVQEELATAEKKAQDAEHEVTNCNKKILQMEEELDSVTEKLNTSITKVKLGCHLKSAWSRENKHHTLARRSREERWWVRAWPQGHWSSCQQGRGALEGAGRCSQGGQVHRRGGWQEVSNLTLFIPSLMSQWWLK